MDVGSHWRTRRTRRRGLARGCDRLEALVVVLLITVAIAMIGLAVWVGRSASDADRRAEARWRAGSHPVVATAGPGAPVPVGDGPSSPWQVPVTWPAPDDTAHSGTLRLAHPIEAGTAVPVLVGADGTPRAESDLDPRSTGLVVGMFTLLGGWVVLALLWLAAREQFLRRNCRRWEAEWRLVEPRWTGRGSA